MPKASKKTKEQLYSLIYEEIMKKRILINKEIESWGVGNLQSSLIDAILFELNVDCPQKAIDYFKD